MTFTIEKTVVYPDKVHTVQKTPFGEMTSVVSGDTGWSKSPMGDQDMDATMLAAAKEELQTDMLGIMRNLDDFTCQALAPRQVEGKDCLPVYVTGVGEDYRIIFLGAADHLPVMVQQPGQSPMTGAPTTQKVYLDAYQTVAGMTMPKTVRLTFDDEAFGTGTVESFEANPKVDMALFTK